MSAQFDFALPTPADDELTRLRKRIAASYRAEEAQVVRLRIDEARLTHDELAPTQALASRLAEAVRAERAAAGGVDALMLEFSLDSREEVDDFVRRAVAGGAREEGEATDHGFMYERGFVDLDGHNWGPFWMEESQMPAH